MLPSTTEIFVYIWRQLTLKIWRNRSLEKRIIILCIIVSCKIDNVLWIRELKLGYKLKNKLSASLLGIAHVKMKQNRIFIENLPETATESEISSKFTKYGDVISIEIKERKVVTAKHSSCFFAYVNLKTDDSSLQRCK